MCGKFSIYLTSSAYLVFKKLIATLLRKKRVFQLFSNLLADLLLELQNNKNNKFKINN